MWLMRFFAKFRAQSVGTDSYGNRYFEGKRILSKTKKSSRRWVIYNGPAEASKIPAEWHGWLHHTHARPITIARHVWQKPHEVNLTGTPGAYRPAGSLYKNFRSKVAQRYEAWRP